MNDDQLTVHCPLCGGLNDVAVEFWNESVPCTHCGAGFLLKNARGLSFVERQLSQSLALRYWWLAPLALLIGLAFIGEVSPIFLLVVVVLGLLIGIFVRLGALQKH